MHLLKYFKALSLKPENTKELRGLVLDLVIRGRLTAEWRKEHPEVEPASGLLERIRAEKQRLIKKKKIKKVKPLPEIKKEEIPFELPEEWVWCRLGEIITLKSGQDLKPSEYSDTEKIGLPYITGASNLLDGKVIINRWTSHPKSIAFAGDLLLTCKGSGVGKMGWLNVDRAHIARQIMAINTVLISQRFIKVILDAKVQFIRLNANGLIPGIDRKTVLNILVPLPPLPEQQAIVQVVDQLMGEIDQLEAQTRQRIQLRQDYMGSALHQLTTSADSPAAWSALAPHFKDFFDSPSSIDHLKEAILQLAVQGKLTAQWRKANPNVEPASVLLERIQAEKQRLIKEKKIKKEKPLLEIEKEEIPFEVPEGWVWCRLLNLTELITKGSSPKWQGVEYVSKDSGILFITSENVGKFELLLLKQKYVEHKFNKIEPRSILKKNDLLMNIVGASIGRTAIFDLDVAANINQAVTIIRLIEPTTHNFFLNFFNSPVCISYMFDKQVDNARPNLSMGNISKFLIPLPPLREQQAIVQIVDQLFAYCDRLQEALATRELQAGQFLQAGIREVMKGGVNPSKTH